jgi:protein TonB
MEIKKSPKADLENKKSTSILIGLVVALGLTFVAFEWAEQDITVYEEALVEAIAEDEELVEVTFREETPPPPPPPAPQETVLSDIIDIQDNETEVEDVEFNSEDEADKRVEIQAPVAPPEEDPEEQRIHVIVEKMP